MRLARFSAGAATHLGLVHGESITDLSARIKGLPLTMTGLIEAWSEYSGVIAALPHTADYGLADVRLLAPVERPGKILGIGLNYADHIAEANMEMPKHQIWFSKPPTAVCGPYDAIERPVVSPALDYEAELVFVIGRRCRHVPEAQAHRVIFGYCAGNDVSVRDWQMRAQTFTLGKSFDTHAPFGPFIVTPDEVGDPHTLDLKTWVNGELRQDSNTRHLVFDCFEQVATLTAAFTLEPGDLVLTGTPSGVGIGFDPKRFLKAGDVVRIAIDRLGHIENRVIAEPADTDRI